MNPRVAASFLPGLLLLGGCAGVPNEPPEFTASTDDAPLAVESETRLLDARTLDDQWFESSVRAGTPNRQLDYSARFKVESGALFDELGDNTRPNADALPSEVGRRTFEQAVRFALPEYLGAPIELGFDRQHATRLTTEGEQHSESSRAHLEWQPDPVRLAVEWRPRRDMRLAGGPVNCLVDGRLSVPYADNTSTDSNAVALSGRHCLVRSPERGLDEMHLDERGLAWHWSEHVDNKVRFHRFEPRWAGYGQHAFEPGYEFGVTHRHSLLGWDLEADVALREAGEARHTQAGEFESDSHWALNLLVSRKLELIEITARWMQADDPLWFVPVAEPIGRERLSLLLDFGDWIRRALPRFDADMSASWERAEQAGGGEDNQVNWNLSVFW